MIYFFLDSKTMNDYLLPINHSYYEYDRSMAACVSMLFKYMLHKAEAGLRSIHIAIWLLCFTAMTFSEYTELCVPLRASPFALHRWRILLSLPMRWTKQLQNLTLWKICSSTSIQNRGRKISRICIWTPLITEAGHTMTGSQKVRNENLEVLPK